MTKKTIIVGHVHGCLDEHESHSRLIWTRSTPSANVEPADREPPGSSFEAGKARNIRRQLLCPVGVN